MLSTASLLPKSQENTFTLFTTTSSTNLRPTIQNSSVFQDSKACYCSSPHKRHISHHLSQSVQSEGSPKPRSTTRLKVVGKLPVVSQQNTYSYKRPKSHHQIRCLRSELGEHGVGKNRFKGYGLEEETFWHIKSRELQAANLALKIFSPSQKISCFTFNFK